VEHVEQPQDFADPTTHDGQRRPAEATRECLRWRLVESTAAGSPRRRTDRPSDSRPIARPSRQINS
jgi:hypothetical protein